MKCRHCKKVIVQGPPTPDSYWYHPRNQSVYCDLRAPVVRAEP